MASERNPVYIKHKFFVQFINKLLKDNGIGKKNKSTSLQKTDIPAIWRRNPRKSDLDFTDYISYSWIIRFQNWTSPIYEKPRLYFKVPSHQIRLGLKWYGWIGLGEYKDCRWLKDF